VETKEANVMTFKGVKQLSLERVRIEVDEDVKDQWMQDVKITECEACEIYRCKYQGAM
jgi:hypothetical protein